MGYKEKWYAMFFFDQSMCTKAKTKERVWSNAF